MGHLLPLLVSRRAEHLHMEVCNIHVYTKTDRGGEEGREGERGEGDGEKRERERIDCIYPQELHDSTWCQEKAVAHCSGVYFAGPGPLMTHIFNCQFSLSLHENVSSFMLMAKTSNCIAATLKLTLHVTWSTVQRLSLLYMELESSWCFSSLIEI